MTLEAQEVHVAPAQQAGIRGPVRRVAGDAAFRLHRSVLKSEWTGFIGMAIEADLVLRRSGAQLLRDETTVLVVAIAAVNEPFIHFVVKGLGEIGTHIFVARIAQKWLRGLQQLGLHFGSMNGMAINAADSVLYVLGAHEIRVLLAEFMAAQAAL